MKKGFPWKKVFTWTLGAALSIWAFTAFLPEPPPVSEATGPKLVIFKQVRIIQYDSTGENAEILLDAETLERNDEQKEMTLHEITGYMVSEDGLPLNIKSDSAVRDGFSGNMRFIGHVELISPSNDLVFESREAFFDYGRKLFYGEHEAKITENDTITTGEGFELSLRTRSGELKRNVKMQIYSEAETS